MYSRFQEKFYFDKFDHSPLLTFEEYMSDASIIVIDCTRQPEVIKKGLVDVRIEFQTKINIPENTTAYCLIIHENNVSYNPYSNIVNKIV